MPITMTQLNSKQVSLLYGTLMGDGSGTINKNARFKIGHCAKQRDYVKYKLNILGEWVANKIESYDASNDSYYFSTKTHPAFTQIYHDFYKGRKSITEKILNNLDNHAMAVWYMDDGSIGYNHVRKNGTRKASKLTLCTDSFTYDEHILMTKWFKEKLQLEARMTTIVRYNKTYYNLCFYGKNIIRFIELIKPYILPCMNYKILLEKTV